MKGGKLALIILYASSADPAAQSTITETCPKTRPGACFCHDQSEAGQTRAVHHHHHHTAAGQRP